MSSLGVPLRVGPSASVADATSTSVPHALATDCITCRRASYQALNSVNLAWMCRDHGDYRGIVEWDFGAELKRIRNERDRYFMALAQIDYLRGTPNETLDVIRQTVSDALLDALATEGADSRKGAVPEGQTP